MGGFRGQFPGELLQKIEASSPSTGGSIVRRDLNPHSELLEAGKREEEIATSGPEKENLVGGRLRKPSREKRERRHPDSTGQHHRVRTRLLDPKRMAERAETGDSLSRSPPRHRRRPFSHDLVQDLQDFRSSAPGSWRDVEDGERTGKEGESRLKATEHQELSRFDDLSDFRDLKGQNQPVSTEGLVLPDDRLRPQHIFGDAFGHGRQITKVGTKIPNRCRETGEAAEIPPAHWKQSTKIPPERDVIALENVQKSFADAEILRGASIEIHPRDRVALVGVNGSGKTTLLSILAGQTEPDRGAVHLGRRVRLSYLPQTPRVEEGVTVFSEVMKSFAQLEATEKELRRLETEMGEKAGAELDAVIEKHSRLQESFEFQRGHTAEHRAIAVLNGLGFTPSDFEKEVHLLSGGEKNRLALARILLEDSDLLILDEPTNNLDLEALEWLEGFLSKWSRALLVVSHDRYFLDRVASRTVHLRSGSLRPYRGNYSAFVATRTAERQAARKEQRLQEAEIRRTEEFIRRNLEGQKTKQAQSRRKKLEKTERVEVEGEETGARFHFQSGIRSGDLVLEANHLEMGYGNETLFSNLTFELRRKERLGIVGPNGCGKSTLLKILTGQIRPQSGSFRTGSKVHPGIFDQDHRDLDPKNTILDEIHDLDPTQTEENVRSFLGALRFRGNDVFKNIGDLSGGERARVALAKLALGDHNLLFLDEPTNHLDLLTREVLEQSLKDYDGTLVVISHDRYFLDRVTERSLLLGGPTPRLFSESYPAVLARLRREREEEANRGRERNRTAKSGQSPAKTGGERKKSSGKRLSFQKLEEKIMETEEALGTLEAQLSSPEIWNDKAETKPLLERLEQTKSDLECLNRQWEERIEEEESK